MKFRKYMAATLACVLAISLASCGSKKNADTQSEDSKGEWWEVSREGMDEEESTPEESSSKPETASSSEADEDTSSATDASSKADDSSSKGGTESSKESQKSNRSGDGTTEEEYYEDPDTPAEYVRQCLSLQCNCKR